MVDSSIDHLLPWMPWAKDEPTPYLKMVERLRTFRSLFDRDENYIYGAFTSDESKVIGGSGGWTRRTGNRPILVKFCANPVATEIASVLTQIGFEVNGANRIETRCDGNVRNTNILAKLGYMHEASLRDSAVKIPGARSETMIWALFAEEFNAETQNIPFKAIAAHGNVLKTHLV